MNEIAGAAGSREPQLVVGIGASAGGIAALQKMFAAVEPDTGCAYIVILHLSPDHESHLAEVLQATARIPVGQVRARVRIERDHVYVVPPNKQLSLVHGDIDIQDVDNSADRRAPVDLFFRRLAESYGARAVSVILSGTGADGSLGLKRIKECGGLCIGQPPEEAEFDDMPRNAIATALVDFVIPAAEIPQRLRSYARQLAHTALPEGDLAEDGERALGDIFMHMRLRTGHDFSNYKRTTLFRRLERRMNVREVASLPAYAAYLQANGDETQALLKDLLISVTNFFRDSKAFAALEANVLPRLFEDKGSTDHVRVWVAGCATGEEAYSIAMLLAERTPELTIGPAVQLFATDIDEDALAHARAGFYTLNDAADVSPERLRRFFVKDGEGYRVRRELREMVLFASHNAVTDPPFSHLDLVSCRNLFIYLNRAAQERVLRLFHFGLRGGGYLFLGTSETADEIGNLFVSVDKENHIFRSRGMEASAGPLAFEAPALPTRAKIEGPGYEARARARLSVQDLHLRLLERYAPPSLIVNREFEILHLSEHAGRYLQFVGGAPSQNLLRVVHAELRLQLQGVLYRALQQDGPTEAVAGPVSIDGQPRLVKLVASPVVDARDTARGFILVVFETIEAEAGEAAQEGHAAASPGEPMARELEEELGRLRAQLRNTVEQYEMQQEELKASNEELQAMNEELRSSAEELETSKEELQSLNEELTTVNQELKIKVEELSQANNDTRNLMNSTDIATVFVDRGLRIKLFTPRARALFNLLPVDAGRSLLDITHRLDYPEMLSDIERVLDKLAMSDREIASVDGRWYIARVLPYRTGDDRIAGVVLTFTDITERRLAEGELRESEERLRLLLERIPEFALFTLDTEGRIRTWNVGAEEMFGYSEREAVGQSGEIIFTPEDRAKGVPEQEMRQARETGRAPDERWHIRKDGSRFFVSGVMAPLVRDKKLVGYTKLARDLTQRRSAEERIREAHDLLEARVRERTGELASANDALRRQMEQHVKSEEVRLRLLRQLVNAQEQERSRISRELHDQLGQEITALGLKLAMLKQTPRLSDAARAEIDGLERIAHRLDDDVEFLVWQLRPTGLDDLGLGDSLTDYAASWSKYFGIPARVHSTIERRLPAEVETVLYRVAQEALNNVAKHARAQRVEMGLEVRDGGVALTIEDDGRGFDAGAALQGKTLGLVGIRERVALVGGSAGVESRPGEGTRLVIQVPLSDA